MTCGLTERTRGKEEEGRAMVMFRERRERERDMKTLSERRKEEKVKEERDEGLK